MVKRDIITTIYFKQCVFPLTNFRTSLLMSKQVILITNDKFPYCLSLAAQNDSRLSTCSLPHTVLQFTFLISIFIHRNTWRKMRFLCFLGNMSQKGISKFLKSNSVCFSYSKEVNICLLELHVPFELGPGLLCIICSRAIFALKVAHSLNILIIKIRAAKVFFPPSGFSSDLSGFVILPAALRHRH